MIYTISKKNTVYSFVLYIKRELAFEIYCTKGSRSWYIVHYFFNHFRNNFLKMFSVLVALAHECQCQVSSQLHPDLGLVFFQEQPLLLRQRLVFA